MLPKTNPSILTTAFKNAFSSVFIFCSQNPNYNYTEKCIFILIFYYKLYCFKNMPIFLEEALVLVYNSIQLLHFIRSCFYG